MDKLLYRIEPDATEATGLSRSKIYELIAMGEIRAVHVGRSVRIPVDALREWIDRLAAAQA